jgi:hypothetical protein
MVDGSYPDTSGLRTFDTSGTVFRRTGNVLTITCESGEIANRVADQLRTPIHAQPFAWVIGSDNNANDKGFIDAMAWSEGEFTTPVYLLPQPLTGAQGAGNSGVDVKQEASLMVLVEKAMDEWENDQEAPDTMSCAQHIAITLAGALSLTSTSRGTEANPADEIIGQIEERFPDWRGFRDLVDCIDVTLHRLRGGS